MTNLKEVVDSYRKLREHNDEALGKLTDIARGNIKGEKHVEDLKSSIYQMVECFKKFAPENAGGYLGRENYSGSQYVSDLQKKIDEIFSNKRLEIGCSLIKNLPFSLVSPSLRQQIRQISTKGMNDSKDELSGEFDLKRVGVDKVDTPHEMVRYIHRAANEIFFDPNSTRWSRDGENSTINDGGLALYLASIDGENETQVIKENPFLIRFKEIAQSKRFKDKRQSKDTFLALADSDNLSIQMPLGCHYATLRVSRQDNKYGLHLRFIDTINYSASEFRTCLSKAILERLGLEVKRDKNVLDAATSQGLQKALDTYEMLQRFSVSLMDVDMVSSTDKLMPRMNDTVDAFYSGVINLREYLRNYKPKSYNKYVKDKSIEFNQKDAKVKHKKQKVKKLKKHKQHSKK